MKRGVVAALTLVLTCLLVGIVPASSAQGRGVSPNQYGGDDGEKDREKDKDKKGRSKICKRNRRHCRPKPKPKPKPTTTTTRPTTTTTRPTTTTTRPTTSTTAPPTTAPPTTAPPTTAPPTTAPPTTAPPTTTLPPPPPPGGNSPTVGGCRVFPSDNAWNTDISGYPLHTNSANFINSMGASRTLHPDFGGNGEYGIPFVVVPQSQPMVPIEFTAYGDESDPGPYPIPWNAPIEGGPASDGDRHVIVVQQGTCRLYELYRSFRSGTESRPSWAGDSGAVFDLNSNALRPIGWTSADAAGLPILPGLVRYEEVAAGEVRHAIRFTASRTQRGFILPATHYASSSTDPNLPPMGLRVRLRASYDISGLHGQALVIARAMKKYGMIMADNGSSWFFQGDGDPRWDDEDVGQLRSIPGSAFEAVNTGPVRTS